MKRVILESPYAGDIVKHTIYARQCIKDSLMRGEAPIASHMLYTQPGILDDTIKHERKLGIMAGLLWVSRADAMVVYTDHGTSAGMKDAIEEAKLNNLPIEYRKIIKTA